MLNVKYSAWSADQPVVGRILIPRTREWVPYIARGIKVADEMKVAD